MESIELATAIVGFQIVMMFFSHFDQGAFQ
ncbi:hypothetical protein DSM3645_22184 [Blastopirellula marina DSM 3645]|uniref:Uncharacterized protein n=1 Tax=Blastopirellula marina DSM 3645 TaxID=314230 RepID=A3ZUI5_9BACT|nr:hypothetical protein DSM3645_22184 [Blastopirellula marina DSM 3645]